MKENYLLATNKNTRLHQENENMREVLEWIIYRCDNHRGRAGNPDWGPDTIEYILIKQALTAGEGGAE